jgi:hypothetical protein
MLSVPREVAKALDTDHALMPEAGESFDFTSYLECVARVCRGKKARQTNRNYGDYVYTFSRFNVTRCGLQYGNRIRFVYHPSTAGGTRRWLLFLMRNKRSLCRDFTLLRYEILGLCQLRPNSSNTQNNYRDKRTLRTKRQSRSFLLNPLIINQIRSVDFYNQTTIFLPVVLNRLLS